MNILWKFQHDRIIFRHFMTLYVSRSPFRPVSAFLAPFRQKWIFFDDFFFQNVPQGEALLVPQIFFEFEDGKTSKTYKESVKNGPKMQNFNFGAIFDPFGFILRKSGIMPFEREFHQLSNGEYGQFFRLGQKKLLTKEWQVVNTPFWAK